MRPRRMSSILAIPLVLLAVTAVGCGGRTRESGGTTVAAPPTTTDAAADAAPAVETGPAAPNDEADAGESVEPTTDGGAEETPEPADDATASEDPSAGDDPDGVPPEVIAASEMPLICETRSECRVNPRLTGMSEAEVVETLGDPPHRDGDDWTYRYPPGCTDRVDLLTIRFEDGRVASATVRRERTGDVCEK